MYNISSLSNRDSRVVYYQYEGASYIQRSLKRTFSYKLNTILNPLFRNIGKVTIRIHASFSSSSSDGTIERYLLIGR
jgi:hypothetical protein